MNLVFLTGAAGFVGSHTAQELLRRGHSVVALDNLNDYYDPARKRANIEEVTQGVPSGLSFEFIAGDVRDRELVESLFERHDFTAVVHLAAMAGVRNSIDFPDLYYDVNVQGALNVLNAVRDHDIGNVVLASTSSVYGRTKTIPFVETDNCDRPLSPYAASKRASEMLGFTYHHLFGLNVTALRFFTVYGPRGRPDMMAYKVLENIFHGAQVPIYNDGNMHRDWTYIDDVASGVVSAVERPLGYEVMNIGRGEPTLLLDFVKQIEILTGREAQLNPEPMPAADIPYTFADITKARRLLEYDPAVSVTEGVTRFWEWYQTEILAHV